MMWESLIRDKKVLFITTKNLDYIRVVQEINILKEMASGYSVIGSGSMHYAVRLVTVYWKLFFTRISRYDTVFLGFAPQLIFPVWGWKFKKKGMVIDFFLSMYDTLCCDRKWIKANGLLGKLLHWLDRQVLQGADFIISDTKEDGKYFCREFQVPSQKVSALYLQADKNIYHPLNRKRPEMLQGKYIVLYFGSVLPLQGTDIVLKAMERLKMKEEIYFFFIGPVSDKYMEVPIPKSSNIQYIDWLSQEKLAEYIDMADLCLAGHFNASIEKASRTIPGKAYIYQAMGKQMILGDNPANREFFNGDKSVYFVEMGNDEALVRAIMEEWKKNF